jgi:hypothetical protein
MMPVRRKVWKQAACRAGAGGASAGGQGGMRRATLSPTIALESEWLRTSFEALTPGLAECHRRAGPVTTPSLQVAGVPPFIAKQATSDCPARANQSLRARRQSDSAENGPTHCSSDQKYHPFGLAACCAGGVGDGGCDADSFRLFTYPLAAKVGRALRRRTGVEPPRR